MNLETIQEMWSKDSIIDPDDAVGSGTGEIACKERLGGLLPVPVPDQISRCFFEGKCLDDLLSRP